MGTTMDDSEVLKGGNSNQVKRQGQTVIRQQGAWSPFVHQLLEFLTAHDFTESPRLLDTTPTTETLTFIEGDVGNDPLKQSMLSDEVIREAAQLLRKFHDLTQDFVVPKDAVFFLPIDTSVEHEVICHNDFAPYNCVYKDGHIIGIIDFDTASPSSRLWDIAYAVYRFIPLMTDSHCIDMGWHAPPDRFARLKLFCDVYALEDRALLIDTVIQRIESLVQFMRNTSSNLDHIPFYDDDLAYIRANQRAFENVLHN
jgi:hypothetical protein